MEGFLNPEEVLKNLNLKEDMVACDFGSGSGGWVLPLARTLTEGKIYAIDILEEPLSALKGKAEIFKIQNIETIRSDVEKKRGSTIKDNEVDLVFMTNLLFEVEDKKGVLVEGKRILKKGGKILVIDWKQEAVLGPKTGRISPDEIKDIVKKLDLKIENEFKAGDYHWGLILAKP